MSRRRRLGSRAALALSFSLLPWLCGCTDGSVFSIGTGAAFSSSGTPPAADLVRLTYHDSQDELLEVDVSLGGPTTSDAIYGFSFVLELGDPSLARFEGGTYGPALEGSGCAEPLVLIQPVGDRIVVGASKLFCAGQRVMAQESAIVTLTFRMMEPGTTSLRIMGAPDSSPSALDADSTVIDSVHFDAEPARLISR